MSDHETPAELEHERQIAQSAHESAAFEQSDAAKVAAVAAVVDGWRELDADPRRSQQYRFGFAKALGIAHEQLREALVDPDSALERVRAEARAEALRDAADAIRKGRNVEPDDLLAAMEKGQLPADVRVRILAGWHTGMDDAARITEAAVQS